jgi:hypothetical protein
MASTGRGTRRVRKTAPAVADKVPGMVLAMPISLINQDSLSCCHLRAVQETQRRVPVARCRTGDSFAASARARAHLGSEEVGGAGRHGLGERGVVPVGKPVVGAGVDLLLNHIRGVVEQEDDGVRADADGRRELLRMTKYGHAWSCRLAEQRALP